MRRRIAITGKQSGCCTQTERKSIWKQNAPSYESVPFIEENFVMITLMADDKRELPEILEINTDNGVEKMRTYGDLWSYLQRHKFGANSQPYYVVLDNEGNLLSGPAYYDENVDNFAKFLNVGIKNYKKSNDE